MSLKELAKRRCRVIKPRLRLGQLHPGTEAEEYAEAIGTISLEKALRAVDVHPEVWSVYKDQYPDTWVKHTMRIICPNKDHPQGVGYFDEETGEFSGGPATRYDSTLEHPERCPPSGGDPPSYAGRRPEILRERTRCYAQNAAKGTTDSYSKYGRFTMQLARPYEKKEKCWIVEEFRTPQQEFKEDVNRGKILHWRTGFKMSDMEAKGKPPETGYLAAMAKGPEAVPHESESYHRGLVIKITGDYDPEIGMKGLDLHNHWAVVTEIIDPWHFKVVPEDKDYEVTIRDTDVKAWIGDQYSDIFGLGVERWKSEVLPLIEDTLGKFP